jgi:hypothetical protein
MNCAHCGHKYSARRTYFGGRLFGGWRCSECDKVFYVDDAQLERKTSGRLQGTVFAFFVALIVGESLIGGVPSYLGTAWIFGFVAIVFAIHSHALGSIPTQQVQPLGQKDRIRLTFVAVVIFWGAGPSIPS